MKPITRILSHLAVVLCCGAPGSLFAEPNIQARVGGPETCVVTGGQVASHEGIFPVAVAAELGSAVIKSGVSALGRYFATAASSTSTPLMTAITTADLFRFVRAAGGSYRAEMALNCLTIAIGPSGTLDASNAPDWLRSDERLRMVDPDKIFVSKRADGSTDVSRLQALGLIDVPSAYYEIRIDKHRSADAIRLHPMLVYFRETSASRSKQEPKSVEITLTLAKPSSTGSLDPQHATASLVAQLPLTIKSVSPGSTKGAGANDFETVWVAEPDAPGADAAAAATKFEAESGQAPPTVQPVNIFVSYRETDQPELMYQVMATFLGDNSTSVEKASADLLQTLLTALAQRKR